MTRVNSWKSPLAIFVFCVAATIVSSGQTFTSLVSFDLANGQNPYGLLAQGRDGELYGTTAAGGTNDNGTVFKMSSGGQLTTFDSACTGRACPIAPLGSLVLAAGNGDFYGMTEGGGANGQGTVFRITPAGKQTNLYSFCAQSNCSDGDLPFAGLAPGPDGNFYGTTEYGGANCGSNSDCLGGTVFKITPAGLLTTLYSFCAKSNCADGQIPEVPLLAASDGNFYGTTYNAGAYGYGTIFKITPTGTLTTLYNFCSQAKCIDGYDSGELMQGLDGNIYGATVYGGVNGWGTIFKITPGGKLTTVYNFCSRTNCADGGDPYGVLVQATDGNFYGTTSLGGTLSCGGYDLGCGTIFKITPTGALTTLHSFNATDGYEPNGMVQATDGNFYGSTLYGGNPYCPDGGCGTVFTLSVGLDPFVSLVRDRGKIGQLGGILGQGLTGTTGVSVNGISASFIVVSDTYIQATIPAGAKSGYVTVTTPNGTLTSNVPFRVIP